MKVRANFADGKFGFYGGVRRRNGDVFELSNSKDFSSLWMVKLEEKPRKGRKPNEETESQDECGPE